MIKKIADEVRLMREGKTSLLLIPSHDAGLQALLLSVKGIKQTIYLLLTYDSQFEIPQNVILVKHAVAKKGASKKSFFKSIALYFPQYFVSLIECKVQENKIAARTAFLGELCETHNISTVLINNDRSYGFEYSAFLLKNERRLKIINLSFASSADISSIAFIRKGSRYYYQKRGDWNTQMWNGKWVSFYPYSIKQHIEKYCDKSIDPFVYGMSFCDITLLPCEREKERLIALGADSQRYIVCGQAVHDYLFEAKQIGRRDMLEKYNIKRQQKFILLAVPVYFEHGFVDQNTSDNLIYELILKLKQSGLPILMALHPKAKPEYYQKFCDHNINLCKEPTYEVMPHCHILVSAYSSVTEWAICLQKKVLLVDQIGFNYDFFFEEFNLPVAKTSDKIVPSLNMALSQPQSYDDALIASLPAIDGKAIKRIQYHVTSDV